jgi:hypothetical protein
MPHDSPAVPPGAGTQETKQKGDVHDVPGAHFPHCVVTGKVSTSVFDAPRTRLCAPQGQKVIFFMTFRLSRFNATAAAGLCALAFTAATAQAQPAGGGATRSLTLVGHTELLGHTAVYGNLWVHGNYIYVGAWDCSDNGVHIVDASDKANPTRIGSLANYPGTSEEDIRVRRIVTPHFNGDLLAVGLQVCARGTPGAVSGLDLWDVSNPTNPQHLSTWNSGMILGGNPAGGVHELELFQKGNRAFVIAATPWGEVLGQADVRIIEVTDPFNPVEISNWTAGRDLGLPFGAFFFPAPFNCGGPPCRGAVESVNCHSVSVNQNGTRAFLSYWDAGMIILDISTPEAPTFIGRADPSAFDGDGDLHTAVVTPNGRMVITSDEDYSPVEGGDALWGGVRIWDISNPQQPVQISSIYTTNAVSGRTDGIYSAHNITLRGNLLFVAWYSDGVRVFDISNPKNPREVGSFVPPAHHRPEHAGSPAEGPLVWGVQVQNNHVYLSDMNQGLYILRMAP